MILLDKPYVSDLLLKTIHQLHIPVIKNQNFDWLRAQMHLSYLEGEQAITMLNKTEWPLLYSNSENAIAWMDAHLQKTKIPEKVALFKNKARFRDLMADKYPDFIYRELSFEELQILKEAPLPFPFIIKPNVGFFSLNVYKVESVCQWEMARNSILNSGNEAHKLYPEKVINTHSFIAEQLIVGDEYAMDAYFNSAGEGVIVGIFKHLFSSDTDVSDRVYYTSKDLIEQQLEPFGKFLNEIGQRAQLRNFPMHIEVRVDSNGKLIPIEVNPMRFGGWCTTADLTTLALQLNPYMLFFNQQKPDWGKVLEGKEGKKFCMVLLDNSTGYATSEIEAFNYQKMEESFEKVLEIRPTDWHTYPLFGIIFTETRDHNFQEIEAVLTSDLREFITLKTKN